MMKELESVARKSINKIHSRVCGVIHKEEFDNFR